MPDYIYQISDVWLFILINAITIFLSILAINLINAVFPVADRYKENQVIGYISLTVCMIFAILSGFAALYALNNFNNAKEVVQREANVAMAIYQDAGWLDHSERTQFQKIVKEYYILSIEHDWPLMTHGYEVDMTTDLLIKTLEDDLHKYSSNSKNPVFALQEITKEIIALRAARADRVRLAQTDLRTDMWVVILLTAFIIIAVNCLFGMPFRLHFLLICVVSLVVSSMVFLILVLDHPFQGTYAVKPHAFHYSLKLIDF